jgi:hypothetical protein
MEEVVPSDRNIKERIKLLKVQPWGYGYSYIPEAGTIN